MKVGGVEDSSDTATEQHPLPRPDLPQLMLSWAGAGFVVAMWRW